MLGLGPKIRLGSETACGYGSSSARRFSTHKQYENKSCCRPRRAERQWTCSPRSLQGQTTVPQGLMYLDDGTEIDQIQFRSNFSHFSTAEPLKRQRSKLPAAAEIDLFRVFDRGTLQPAEMVQRLTYRRRHAYATKSNRTRVVKTPGIYFCLNACSCTSPCGHCLLGRPGQPAAPVMASVCCPVMRRMFAIPSPGWACITHALSAAVA